MAPGNGFACVVCLDSISLAAMTYAKIAARGKAGTEGTKVVIL